MTMILDVLVNIGTLGPSLQEIHLHNLPSFPKGTNSLLFSNHLKRILGCLLLLNFTGQNTAVRRKLLLNALNLLE